MIKRSAQRLLATIAICLAPGTVAAARVKSLQVPEGGSTAIYIIGAGLVCFGAMFLRSKLAKPTKP